MASRDSATRPASADAGETVVFRGSNGLWITLAVLAGLAAVLAVWFAATSVAGDGAAAALGALLKGGIVVALLALGAWFAASQRREVTLDPEGITIRTIGGRVRQQRTWSEIIRVEPRQLPSLASGNQPPELPTGAGRATPRQLLTQPSRPTVLIHCTDGSALLIDPQQVRDTANLLREADRRKRASRT